MIPKMNYFNVFLLFVIFTNEGATPFLITDPHKLEKSFIEKVLNQENKPNTLCDLPKKIKAALCNAILEIPVKTKYSQKVKLNTAAFYYLNPKCVANLLTFVVYNDYNKMKPTQEMFPCYGRHSTIRTHWAKDDSFDSVYLSGGPEKNMISIYIRNKLTISDEYILAGSIDIVSVEKLPLPKINFAVVTEELKLLKYVSRNTDVEEIEINYTREFATSEIEIINSVCDLDVESKYLLCQKIMRHPDFPIKNYVLKYESFNEESSICRHKPLYFMHINDLNNKRMLQRMYPCYGAQQHPDDVPDMDYWHLSQGFRENSILMFIAYREHSFSGFFQFFEFYENIYFEKLLDFTDITNVASSRKVSFAIGKQKEEMGESSASAEKRTTENKKEVRSSIEISRLFRGGLGGCCGDV